jgi:lipid A 3-O-deacylase
MKLLLCCALTLLAKTAPAQAISTTGVERETQREQYWRISYDNDFFAATDYYFTQGILVEAVSPRLRAFPLRRALIAPSHTARRFGLAYEDDGYTATDLKAPQILLHDHPYAGTKQFRMFAISIDSARQLRVTSALNLGIIGQGAGGAEIQTFIHRHTGNTIPQGWGNQIRNDLILNYEAGLERALLRRGDRLLVTGSAIGRLGTYNTAVTAGATVLVGHVGNAFGTNSARRQWYAYAKPQLNLVGYDATLQGGMFNRSSPYTIASRDLERAVYRQQFGIVYRSRTHFFEYYQSLGTREFSGGRAHKSGGIVMGFLRGR